MQPRPPRRRGSVTPSSAAATGAAARPPQGTDPTSLATILADHRRPFPKLPRSGGLRGGRPIEASNVFPARFSTEDCPAPLRLPRGEQILGRGWRSRSKENPGFIPVWLPGRGAAQAALARSDDSWPTAENSSSSSRCRCVRLRGVTTLRQRHSMRLNFSHRCDVAPALSSLSFATCFLQISFARCFLQQLPLPLRQLRSVTTVQHQREVESAPPIEPCRGPGPGACLLAARQAGANRHGAAPIRTTTEWPP